MQRAALAALVVLAVVLGGCAATQQPVPVPTQLRGPGGDLLLLHVHHAGDRPSGAAVADVQARLSEALPLPVAWGNQSVETDQRAWTTQRLVALSEQDAARAVEPPGAVHVHVLWVPGSFPDERGVPLGVFVRPDPVVAVFHEPLHQVPDHLRAVGVDPPVPEQVEATVLLHVVLHALGLVDCGLPTQEPRGASCHSDEPDSLMHSDWGHLDGWITRALRGASLEPRITAADRADLALYAPGA